MNWEKQQGLVGSPTLPPIATAYARKAADGTQVEDNQGQGRVFKLHTSQPKTCGRNRNGSKADIPMKQLFAYSSN